MSLETVWLPTLLSATACLLVYLYQSSKVTDLEKDNKNLRDEIAARSALIESLRNQIREGERLKPTEELTAFLADCKTHGYGFVRVDPDTVFHKRG
jgi:hypothetical protein